MVARLPLGCEPRCWDCRCHRDPAGWSWGARSRPRCGGSAARSWWCRCCTGTGGDRSTRVERAIGGRVGRQPVAAERLSPSRSTMSSALKSPQPSLMPPHCSPLSQTASRCAGSGPTRGPRRCCRCRRRARPVGRGVQRDRHRSGCDRLGQRLTVGLADRQAGMLAAALPANPLGSSSAPSARTMPIAPAALAC